MTNLQKIESKRKFQHIFYWQIVYEWEDIFSKILNLPIKEKSGFEHYFKQILPSFISAGVSLIFDMGPRMRMEIPFLRAKRNMIPFIIDFWVTEDNFKKFILAYKRAPLVLVSSMEVYDFLKRKNAPISFEHLGLSIPDNQAKVCRKRFIDKKYDLVLAGRMSDIYQAFLEEYIKINPNLKVVRKSRVGDVFYYEYKGDIVCKAESRETYISMLEESRVFLYSTPGFDGDKRTNGFSPVTPRFMEGIAAGCNMILRYPDNPDTKYYELYKFNEPALDFNTFCRQMDVALTKAPDLDFYTEYLNKHRTSERAEALKKILKRYDLY